MRILHLIFFVCCLLLNQARAQDIDFQSLLKPASKQGIFQQAGYHVWCGTVTKGADKKYYLFYSRWPEKAGHLGWVTHSEVAVASSKSATGPFKFVKVVLAKRDKQHWDADVTHNPTVHCFNGKYYLYYMGNYGNGEFWNNRNHQRIGMAVAKHPLGPWQRMNQPLIDVDTTHKDSYDFLMTSNPAVCKTAEGCYAMVYKSVSNGPMPFGGKVYHKVAFADKPTGPFIKKREPIFQKDTVRFAAEDPYIWYQGTKYWALVKDFKGSFTKQGLSLALFESKDAINWQVAKYPLASTTRIQFTDTVWNAVKVERPQLLIEKGVPKVLYVAVMMEHEESFNIAIPLKAPTSKKK